MDRLQYLKIVRANLIEQTKYLSIFYDKDNSRNLLRNVQEEINKLEKEKKEQENKSKEEK